MQSQKNNEQDQQKKKIKNDEAISNKVNAEEKITQGCEEIENKYKRALADYQNLMKQAAQEKIEIVRYANENMLYQILPVYDNLKISLNHINSELDQSGWLLGVKHVIRQFKDVLSQLGVEEIETFGLKFDHSIMEAIDKVMTDDKKLKLSDMQMRICSTRSCPSMII